MNVKLLAEHNLGFLSLKVGCTGSYESTLVKTPQCWKSHVMANKFLKAYLFIISKILFSSLNFCCMSRATSAFLCKVRASEQSWLFMKCRCLQELIFYDSEGLGDFGVDWFSPFNSLSA